MEPSGVGHFPILAGFDQSFSDVSYQPNQLEIDSRKSIVESEYPIEIHGDQS